MMRHIVAALCFAAALGEGIPAQTQLHLPTQTREPDFSGQQATKPMRSGATLPANCTTGEYFFLASAPGGMNTYACVSNDTWAVQGGGGGSGGGSIGVGQGDVLRVERTSATRLTINPGCAPASPCNAAFGANSFQFTSSATIDLAGTNTGAVKIYTRKDGVVYVGHNLTDTNVTCTGCVKVPGVTTFPADSIPAYSWPVTSGQFDAEQASYDKRAFLSTKTAAAGIGLTATEASGETTLSVNTGVVSTFSSGTTAPPPSCSVGQKYLRTDTNQAYQCTSTGTWTETTGGGTGGGTAGVPRFSSRRWYYAIPKGVSGGAHTELGLQLSHAGTVEGGTAGATDSAYTSFATAASANSDGGTQGTLIVWGQTKELFQTRGRLTSTTALRAWIGLARNGPFDTDSPVWNAVAAFRYSTAASDTTFKCVTCNEGGTCTVSDSGVAPDTSPHSWEVEHTGSAYVFRIDGTQKCSISATMPANGMAPFFGIRTLEAVTKSVRWYGFYGESDR